MTTKESLDMKWHIYKTLSVDAFWNNLKTVAETERQIGRSGSVSLVVVETQPATPDALAFAEGWLAAKTAACEYGWDGVERSESMVFWLPSPNVFLYGFVIKPAFDNESTFIASPYPLPWLPAA